MRHLGRWWGLLGSHQALTLGVYQQKVMLSEVADRWNFLGLFAGCADSAGRPPTGRPPGLGLPPGAGLVCVRRSLSGHLFRVVRVCQVGNLEVGRAR
jgi:hypothetical protein